MYFEHLFHRRKLWEGGSVHESQKIKKIQITIHGNIKICHF
jgi:hypothetical protein